MRKQSRRSGFTLAELLVVVAIIGVLVAVAIPVFSSALKKAEHAVDVANVRSYMAEQLVNAMANDEMPLVISRTTIHKIAKHANPIVFGEGGDVPLTIQIYHKEDHTLSTTLSFGPGITTTT